MKKITILTLFMSFCSFAECIQEKYVRGAELKKLIGSVYVEIEPALYKRRSEIKIQEDKIYKVQIGTDQSHNRKNANYNSTYIEYYDYSRMQKYLSDKSAQFKDAGYEIQTIGKSLEGRELYRISPTKLTKKKTILMFGRHHGDEGTANWIIEGFLNEYLANKKFKDEYQLLLYPMINPDGTQARTRYNKNGRDLNRSWSADPSQGLDEIKVIHGDLAKYMSIIQDDIFIALDMHGSIREDFVYRVKPNYVSLDFYRHQQNFIDELALYDSWQAGHYIHSNGDQGMARLVLINHYNKHALTHETIKNIPLRNNLQRSKETLKDQGVALIKTIQNLY